jgi:hypothetical protein
MSFVEQVGPFLLLTAYAAAPAAVLRRGPTMRWVPVLVVAILAFVPIAGTRVLGYMYAATGPLSAASLVFLVLLVARMTGGARLRPFMPDAGMMAWVVILFGVPFYALVLQIGAWDPYALGYQSPWVAFALAVLALAGGWMRAPVVSVWLICGTLLFLLNSYASRNIFDYLIDPLAIALAAILLVDRWILTRTTEPAR